MHEHSAYAPFLFLPLMKLAKKRSGSAPMQAPLSVVESGADASDLINIREELNELLVARSSVVKGLILALLSRQHIMLHGPGGLAKTMAASLLFSSIEGDDHRVFKAQLSKGSVTEHLFGPVNLEKFKKESVYEYNTRGMLPDAHFAILDEVYRAPDSLLSLLMSVLNEREIFSSGKVVKCPLHTVVGTTNFVSDNPELAAFHDRWLLNVKVSPLTSNDDKRRMLTNALGQPPRRKHGVTFANLVSLQEAVQEVEFPAIMLTVYVDMISRLQALSGPSALQNPVSDRRSVQALSLVKASALLNGRTAVDLDDLEAAKYGLIIVGEQKEDSAFDQVFGALATTFIALRKDTETIATMEKLCEKIANAYSPDAPKERLEKQQVYVRNAIKAISTENISHPVAINSRDQIIKKLDQILLSISEDLMR